MRRMPWFGLMLVASSVLVMAGASWNAIPLGISGEWTWHREPLAAPAAWLFALPALLAAGLMWFVWQGAQRIGRCGSFERSAWLTGLVCLGFTWLWMIQECAPVGYQLSKTSWILYYNGPSGYYTEAQGRARNLPVYLSHYEELMRQGDVLHFGTHPPGLVIGFRGLIELCARFPRLVDGLLAIQPHSVQESFDLLEFNLAGSSRQLLREERAVLWLAGLMVMAVAALAIIPLYGLLRRYYSAQTSWLAVSFWPAVPALAVFQPKSDALFPFIGCLFLLLWLSGWQDSSKWRCFLAGLTLWVGMMLSLALLPVVMLAGLVTGWEWYVAWRANPTSRGASRKQLLVSALLAAAGFAIPCIGLRIGAGLNMLAVWAWNYRNHGAFYGKFTRTYWKWLLVNPWELAIGGGLPLALLACWGLCQVSRRPFMRAAGLCWGAAITWSCLWLSGKNSGEAARLWIVVMPWLILLAAAALEKMGDGAGHASIERRQISGWGIALGCQLAVSIAIVTRIVGFGTN